MMRYSSPIGSAMARLFATALGVIAVAAVVMLAKPPAVTAQPAARGTQTATAPLITPDEWNRYRARFVASGRVIDDANGNISHSEGQGYGMLLSVLANDPATFDAMWSFVRTNLLIRDDGLIAWSWDPNARPNVTDVNNASDGDVLVAYALLLGARQWDRPELAEAARKILAALTAHGVAKAGKDSILLPGVKGFAAGARPDAPVVNPSYMVFEAFALFSTLDGDKGVWSNLTKSGLTLIDQSRFGPARLVPEWVSLRDPTQPALADGFSAEYGYNALRIPLYLLRAGIGDRARLERFRTLWTRNGQPAPAILDVKTGQPTHVLDDAGYAIIAAALSCALDGTPIPPALTQFNPTLYYPSTLHLLGLALVREQYPQCL